MSLFHGALNDLKILIYDYDSTFPEAMEWINALQEALNQRDELLKACKAVMRPNDGHYEACPCSATVQWGGDVVSGHIFMPTNATVIVCERLRIAIARAERWEPEMTQRDEAEHNAIP